MKRHPGWNAADETDFRNDVCILHLDSELDLDGSRVSSIPLDVDGSAGTEGNQCIIAGWGITNVSIAIRFMNSIH